MDEYEIPTYKKTIELLIQRAREGDVDNQALLAALATIAGILNSTLQLVERIDRNTRPGLPK